MCTIFGKIDHHSQIKSTSSLWKMWPTISVYPSTYRYGLPLHGKSLWIDIINKCLEWTCTTLQVWNFKITDCICPPKVLLLCRSWGACVPRRSQRLCQLEFWLLVGTTMLDRLWARGQTKCNTLLMLATSVFGRIHRRPCYVMAQPKSRLDIPWPNDAECTGHVWCHLPCWYPLFCDVESLAGCVGG